jgi:hypothetical protein
VQALWAAVFASALCFQLPISGYCLWLAARAKTPNVLNVVIFSIVCFNALCLAVVGMLRVVRPEATIGNALDVTIAFFLAWAAAFVCSPLFGVKFLDVCVVLLGLAPALTRRIRRFRRSLPLLLLLAFLNGPSVFMAMPFYPGYDVRYQFIMAFYLGSALTSSLLVVCGVWFGLDPLLQEMRHVVSGSHNTATSFRVAEDLSETMRKVQSVRKNFIVHGLLSVVGALAFSFIPVLNRAGPSYQLPITMVSWSFLTGASAAALTPTKQLRRAPLALRVLMLGRKALSPSTSATDAATLSSPQSRNPAAASFAQPTEPERKREEESTSKPSAA